MNSTYESRNEKCRSRFSFFWILFYFHRHIMGDDGRSYLSTRFITNRARSPGNSMICLQKFCCTIQVIDVYPIKTKYISTYLGIIQLLCKQWPKNMTILLYFQFLLGFRLSGPLELYKRLWDFLDEYIRTFQLACGSFFYRCIFKFSQNDLISLFHLA